MVTTKGSILLKMFWVEFRIFSFYSEMISTIEWIFLTEIPPQPCTLAFLLAISPETILCMGSTNKRRCYNVPSSHWLSPDREYSLSWYRNGAASWNLFPWMTKICLFCIVNTITADDLVMQGVRASAARHGININFPGIHQPWYHKR